MRGLLAPIVLVCACGYPQPLRIGDAASGDATDGPRDTSPPDLPADATPFSAPTKITELASSGFDGDPTLPADMLEIFFKSNRTGGEGLEDIWRSARATTSTPWSTPASVAELSSAASETSPHISTDGLTIWFLQGPSPNKTMVATRATRSSAWSTPVEETEFPGASYAKIGSSTANLTVAYMESRTGSTTRSHIVRSTRANASAMWGTPVEVDELASPVGFTQNPWATPDDLAMIFSSDRTGTIFSGDLWLTTRATTSDPWGPPVDLTEISTVDYDADPWISPDLKHVVFTNSAGGNYEIYESNR